MNRHKRTAWCMLVAVLLAAPFAHWYAAVAGEPHVVLAYSEVALLYPAVLAIWFADEEDT